MEIIQKNKWITCLLGPVAIMRYLLGFFYTMPVVLAWLTSRQKA